MKLWNRNQRLMQRIPNRLLNLHEFPNTQSTKMIIFIGSIRVQIKEAVLGLRAPDLQKKTKKCELLSLHVPSTKLSHK